MHRLALPEGVNYNDPNAVALAILTAEGRVTAERPTSYTPADLPATKKYVFRSVPGHRSIVLLIPGVRDWKPEADPEGKRRAFYEAKFRRDYAEKDRAFFERVVAAVGDYFIHFKQVPYRLTQPDPDIPNNPECWFETDNEDVAEFLRWKMADWRAKKGYDWFVYEDVASPVGGRGVSSARELAALRVAARARGELAPDPEPPPITAPPAPDPRARKRVNGRFVKGS